LAAGLPDRAIAPIARFAPDSVHEMDKGAIRSQFREQPANIGRLIGAFHLAVKSRKYGPPPH
jgi:hypothetical protein